MVLEFLGFAIGAFVSMGIISRLLKWILNKMVSGKKGAIYASLLTVAIAIGLSATNVQKVDYYFIYLASGLFWLAYDLQKIGRRKNGNNKKD